MILIYCELAENGHIADVSLELCTKGRSLTNELYSLLWDANGNLAQQTVYSVNNNVPTFLNMRMLFLDEDDRLNLVAGDGYLSYYAYGYDGNRAIKMTGNAAIDQTGTLLNSTNLENITIYPNEYLTVTQAEYTKYYYAGGNRIASKIGTGGFEKMASLCTEDLNLSANANTLFGNALQQIVNITNQPNDEFPVNVCGGYSVATELLADPLPNFYINSLNLNFTQNNLLQQFRQNLAGVAEAVYYFHSDHLGSASWITDGTGAAVQHLQYLPFGEHFVNEQSSAYFERFTFTGKERDAETGYYYHGARFNSSDLGWLSVDPMSDKYPSMTPYNYCAWNPIKLVDPEGEEVNPIYDFKGKFLGTDDLGLQGEAIIMNNSDFRQNMSHDEAMKNGYTLDNMSNKQALEFANNGNFNNFLDHYNSLCKRPDWDGYLTLDEANDWYRNGNGQTLFTDLRKIDLSGFRSLGESKVGKEYQYNLLVTSGSKDDRLVYGTITFVRKSNDGVRAYADEYDFRMQPWWNPLNWGRNIETLIGRQVAGQGKPYLIYFYGTATLKRSIFAH